MTEFYKVTGETLEEAAMVHGIDSDMLVEEIQSYLQSLG